MKIDDVTKVLKEYFSTKKPLATLMPIASKILLACAALSLLEEWISYPSGIGTILYYAYLLSLVLTLANGEYFFLTIGLSIYGIQYIYSLFYFLIRWQSFHWSILIELAIYAFLIVLAYKKSKNSGQVPQKVSAKVDEFSDRASTVYKNTTDGLKNVTESMKVTPKTEGTSADAQSAEKQPVGNPESDVNKETID